MNKDDFKPDNGSMIVAIGAAYLSYSQYKDKVKNNQYMLVVDFSQPSYKKRMYLVEIDTGIVVREHHVAHGAGSSDPKNIAYAVSFSNKNNSHKSSIGALITGDVYYGKHGKSCRLIGLEPGVNDNVYRRAIVLHPSNYVTDDYILGTGRAGCSFGCLACDPKISSSLIDMVKSGTFVYCFGGINNG